MIEDAAAAGPWLDAELAEPRLLIEVPADLDAAGLAGAEDVLRRTAPAGLLIGPGPGGTERVLALVGLAHRLGAAALVRDDVALAINSGADGVHLGDPRRAAAARRALGAERLLGVTCDASRHAAMEAGDNGADYVLFVAPIGDAGLVDLVRWWSQIFVLPCAATTGPSPAEAEELVRAGADFLVVGAHLWQTSGTPPENLPAIAAALQAARPGPPLPAPGDE